MIKLNKLKYLVLLVLLGCTASMSFGGENPDGSFTWDVILTTLDRTPCKAWKKVRIQKAGSEHLIILPCPGEYFLSHKDKAPLRVMATADTSVIAHAIPGDLLLVSAMGYPSQKLIFPGKLTLHYLFPLDKVNPIVHTPGGDSGILLRSTRK